MGRRLLDNREIMARERMKEGRYDPRLRKYIYPENPSQEASRVRPKRDGSAGGPEEGTHTSGS